MNQNLTTNLQAKIINLKLDNEALEKSNKRWREAYDDLERDYYLCDNNLTRSYKLCRDLETTNKGVNNG